MQSHIWLASILDPWGTITIKARKTKVIIISGGDKMFGKISCKWLVIMLLLVLAITPLLTACSDDGDNDESATVSQSTETVEPTGTVGDCTKQEIFKLGLTGTVFGMSADSRDISAQIAMDEMNEAGGIRIGDTCVKFEYTHEDDRGQAALAIRGIEKLLSWGADAVLNEGSTVPVQVWRPYVEDAKVLNFAQTEPVRDLIGEEYPYTFHMHTDDSPCALILLEWVSKNRPDIKKVHGIRQLMTLYEEQAAVLKDAALPEYGIEYTGTEFCPINAYDFYPILTAALHDDPDAIMCDFYPFPNLGKQARELGFEGTFIVTGAIADYAINSMALKDIEGTVSLTPDPESPLMPQYYRDYKESYHDRQGTYPFSITSFPSYLVPYYIAAAIKAAGSTDSDKLREVMETQTLTLEFPSGETRDVKMGGAELFGINHSFSPPQYLSVIQNGKPEIMEVITAEMTNQYEGTYLQYLEGKDFTTITTAAPTTSQPPVATELTIESPIGQIMDAPGGEALLRKCLGDEVVDNPQMSLAFGMNLPTIAPISGGVITDEMVACVDEGLQTLAAGGTP